MRRRQVRARICAAGLCQWLAAAGPAIAALLWHLIRGPDVPFLHETNRSMQRSGTSCLRALGCVLK